MIVLRVEHDYYGCESGCCGHAVYKIEDGKEVGYEFDFSHRDAGESAEAYARALAWDLFPAEAANGAKIEFDPEKVGGDFC